MRRREFIAGLAARRRDQQVQLRGRQERTIAGWVLHFSAIAPVLRHRSVGYSAVGRDGRTFHQYGLESRHVPFSIDPLPHVMLWSPGRSNDPEITWLRDRIGPIVKSKFADLGDEEAQV
jgi:hypothetical protein